MNLSPAVFWKASPRAYAKGIWRYLDFRFLYTGTCSFYLYFAVGSVMKVKIPSSFGNYSFKWGKGNFFYNLIIFYRGIALCITVRTDKQKEIINSGITFFIATGLVKNLTAYCQHICQKWKVWFTFPRATLRTTSCSPANKVCSLANSVSFC